MFKVTVLTEKQKKVLYSITTKEWFYPDKIYIEGKLKSIKGQCKSLCEKGYLEMKFNQFNRDYQYRKIKWD